MLPLVFHKTLHRAFELRQQGDYLSDAPVTGESAKTLIKDVDKMIEIAVAALKSKA